MTDGGWFEVMLEVLWEWGRDDRLAQKESDVLMVGVYSNKEEKRRTSQGVYVLVCQRQRKHSA